MELDDEVCLCFHVTRRKLENWARVERPRRTSEMSQCGGAGTGCGWCRPLLAAIFDEAHGHLEPGCSIAQITAADHAARRAEYLKNRKRQT